MPTPPRDPLDTLTLDPESLERLRDLSTPSLSDPPRPPEEAVPLAHRAARPRLQSIPFELHGPTAFELTRQGERAQASSPEIEVHEVDAEQQGGEGEETRAESEKRGDRVGFLLILLLSVLAAVVVMLATGLVDPGLFVSMLRDW